MAKIEEPTIDVKLFVDNDKKKVLFAESDKEFVDVLFGFLTMPLGTIVRLLGKQSQMGCLDELYKSVDDLNSEYFQTKACKAMLLKPLNAASGHCCRLKINIDETVPREVYICKDTSCSAHSENAFSSFPDTVCKCGKVMQPFGQWPRTDGGTTASRPEDGIFVQGCLKFIITDDLHVARSSTAEMMSLFEKYGVRDPADLEQKVVQFSSEKITSLLKRSLTSKQPLTGHCFDVPIAHDDASLDTLARNLHPEQQNEAEDRLEEILKIRVLQMKNNSTLLYAEVGDDFVDSLFGLLSIPLGSIMKSFGQCSSKGCLYNLYSSIDGNAKELVRSECQSFLLAPNLPPFFGCCASKILQVDELAPRKLDIAACFTCLKNRGFSDFHQHCHGSTWNSRRYDPNCQKVKSLKLCEVNPKVPNGGIEKGETYVKGRHTKFVVTDDLRVLPHSLSSTLQIVSEAKVQTEKLVEKEITLAKTQVMELQRAVLTGGNVLSSVLLPRKKKKNLNHLMY